MAMPDGISEIGAKMIARIVRLVGLNFYISVSLGAILYSDFSIITVPISV